jgi:hypothetical protein
MCRRKISRGWTRARERERDREFRVRVRERKQLPLRDDVNTARRIRLEPSCDVETRYRDARLRREVSKHQPI